MITRCLPRRPRGRSSLACTGKVATRPRCSTGCTWQMPGLMWGHRWQLPRRMVAAGTVTGTGVPTGQTRTHAMLVEEFVPLLTDRLGRMPPCALRLFHGRLRCALGSGAGSCPRGREPLLGGGGQPAALDLARTDGPGRLSLSGITTTTAPAAGPLGSTRQYNFAASPADRREAIDGTETTIANDTCECWAMVRAPAQSSRKVPSLRTPAGTR